MIPARFTYDYPERCLKIMDAALPAVRAMDLTTSFAVMLAMPLLLVPLERMNAKHPMAEHQAEPALHHEVKRIKRRRFVSTDLWDGQVIDDWRLSKVTESIDNTDAWRNEAGLHPCNPASANEINAASTDKVLRVLRNALAHGNIVYLDVNGLERYHMPAQKIAFISRTDTDPWDGHYRVLIIAEGAFMRFLETWARWMSEFRDDRSLALAA